MNNKKIFKICYRIVMSFKNITEINDFLMWSNCDDELILKWVRHRRDYFFNKIRG